MREAGAIYTLQQRGEAAYACYLQALTLLLATRAGDPAAAVPSYVPSVAELDRALRGYALPAATYRELVDHYEHHGAYGTAEDVLFLLQEAHLQDPQTAAIGQAFYQRLLRKQDAELVTGNLPREEVEDGLVRWQSH